MDAAGTGEGAAGGGEEGLDFFVGGAESFFFDSLTAFEGAFFFSESDSLEEPLEEEPDEEDEDEEDSEDDEDEPEDALRFLPLVEVGTAAGVTGAARVGGPGLGFFALTALSDSSSESDSEEDESLEEDEEEEAAKSIKGRNNQLLGERSK